MKGENVLILGIGNLLWADEGFGVRAVETFNQQYQCPNNVNLMDGGTQGMYLVPYIQQSDILVVFDAIDYGLAPGTLKTVQDQDVPSFMGAKKMSLHQTGFQEVLATATLLDQCPQKILLIGVQPLVLEDYGGSLTDVVKAQLQPAIQLAADYLLDHGIDIAHREQLPSASLSDSSLAIDHYEHLRPTEQQACRVGDDRILHSHIAQFDPKPVEGMESQMSVALSHRKPD